MPRRASPQTMRIFLGRKPAMEGRDTGPSIQRPANGSVPSSQPKQEPKSIAPKPADSADEFRHFRARASFRRRNHEQAANALALLKPYGISLNEVVQDWIARQEGRRSVDHLRGRDGCLLGLA